MTPATQPSPPPPPKGAQVVYQTLNPPYHQWVELFPGLQASVLADTVARMERQAAGDWLERT